MVKYLSYNRADQRFQTILSRPQPFQAEVPEQRYAVDEVDLTPALNVVDAGARAYYANQGQELERESMAISYDTYQANRAAQQSRAAAKEKETGLKNTMLNDYAIAVSRQVLDPYMQGVGGMSPVAAERKLRDLREQYIRMTGGVINATDLMKVEKDSGVTFTKDLYNADLQRQNEQYKADIADFNRVAKDNWEAVYGTGSSAGVPQIRMNQFYTDTIGLYNTLDSSVQNDINNATAAGDPNSTPGSYMSNRTSQTLGEIVELSLGAIRDNALLDADPEYLRPDQMLQTKRDVVELLKNRVQTVNGQQVPLSSIYTDREIEGVVNMAWRYSGIEAPYTAEQARRKEQADYMKNLKDIRQSGNALIEADIKRKELTAKANLQDRLSPSGLYLLENANIISNLDLIDPQKASALRQLVEGSIQLQNVQGDLRPVTEGKNMKNIADKAMQMDLNTGLQMKSANVAAGEAALNNTPGRGYIPYSIWDVPSAYEAMNDRQNTLLNGNEDPSSSNTDTKEKNTETHRELYLKARRNSEIWDKLSAQEQEEMTRSYGLDTSEIINRNIKLLQTENLTDNIVYDASSGFFTPVNFTGDAGSSKEAVLFKVVDTLNNATHTGIKELDNGLLTSIRNTNFRDKTQEDRITRPSNTVKLSRKVVQGASLFDIVSSRETYGAIAEGMKNVGETVMEGAVALGEKAGEGAVTVYETMADNVETIADAVLDPNRSASEEYLRGAADTFSDWVLADSDMSPEEKQKAKDEFYNDVVTPAVDTVKDVARPVVDFISDAAEGVSDLTKKYIVEPFKDMLNTVQEAATFTSDITTVPTYNLGIMSRIIKGDNTVTPQEANAALVAYRQASISDKRKLDKEFNIGPFSENIESQLKDAAKKSSKSLMDYIIPSANAGEFRDPYAEGTPFYPGTLTKEEVNKKPVESKKKSYREPVIDPYAEGMISEPDYKNLSMTTQYNTKLTEKENEEFNKWASDNNLLRDLEDYDLKGAWKAGERPDKNGHLTDKWKKPNHPTFSTESIYAKGSNKKKAGHWEGNTFVAPKSLSKQREEWLIWYFKNFEPDAKLVFEE